VTRVAFFDYPDVFEDFYPHYGVDQRSFAREWSGSANHGIAALLQREVGDIIWYERSLAPSEPAPVEHRGGFQVRFVRSSAAHRRLWQRFYLSPDAWRRQQRYGAFARAATYAAPLSTPLVRALAADRPDAFFVQDYANGLFDELVVAARVLGRPLVAYHSGSFPAGYLARRPKQWTIKRADALLVPGAAERRRLVAEHGVDPARIHRLLTPIDTKTFAPVDRRAAALAAGLDPDRRYVLFVGRLDDSVKRISAIVRAFAAVAADRSDVDLVIAGDGPDREPLRKFAAGAAPRRVLFPGWVADDLAKAALYNAADLLVLASRSEGFPSVVGESLACGTPVLATDAGAVSELVHDGETGWLLANGHDVAVTAALTAALDRALAAGQNQRMRDAARQLALTEVKPAVVGAQLAALFGELMATTRRPRG